MVEGIPAVATNYRTGRFRICSLRLDLVSGVTLVAMVYEVRSAEDKKARLEDAGDRWFKWLDPRWDVSGAPHLET